MSELIKEISSLPNVYEDFIYGVLNYARRKPEHVELLLNYLHNNDNLTTSDVVYFISTQPDFHDYSAVSSVAEKIIAQA